MLAGVRLVSPSPEAVPVATVLVPAPTSKATIEGHKLLDSLVTKFPLNTFSTPPPPPKEDPPPPSPPPKGPLPPLSGFFFLFLRSQEHADDTALYAATGVPSEL